MIFKFVAMLWDILNQSLGSEKSRGSSFYNVVDCTLGLISGGTRSFVKAVTASDEFNQILMKIQDRIKEKKDIVIDYVSVSYGEKLYWQRQIESKRRSEMYDRDLQKLWTSINMSLFFSFCYGGFGVRGTLSESALKELISKVDHNNLIDLYVTLERCELFLDIYYNNNLCRNGEYWSDRAESVRDLRNQLTKYLGYETKKHNRNFRPKLKWHNVAGIRDIAYPMFSGWIMENYCDVIEEYKSIRLAKVTNDLTGRHSIVIDGGFDSTNHIDGTLQNGTVFYQIETLLSALMSGEKNADHIYNYFEIPIKGLGLVRFNLISSLQNNNKRDNIYRLDAGTGIQCKIGMQIMLEYREGKQVLPLFSQYDDMTYIFSFEHLGGFNANEE